MPDEQGVLIEKASGGDRAALEALLERNLPDLRAYVRLRAGRTIRAKESCSDLVQSVCREVLEDLDQFVYHSEAGFRHWLFKRTLNKIIDRSRYWDADKRSPEREVPLRETSPSSSESVVGSQGLFAGYVDLCSPSRIAMQNELLGRLEQAFDQLPGDYREAIVLHRVVGLSQSEIAAEMGRSIGAIRNLVYRGLARLALALDDSTADGADPG